MVSYIRSDLDFILDQIKIAEAHAGGQPLYGPGGLVPSYTLSFGLRTVDGTNNNLLAGQERWGAADIPFPELLTPEYRPASDILDLNGPAPGGLTASTYAPSNNPGSVVVDSSLRMISNLIVDQTLGNPAANLKGLQIGGVASADMANVGLVTAIYDVFKPFVSAEYAARVAAQAAQHAAESNTDPLLQAGLDADAAAAAALAAAANNDLIAARGTRDVALEPFGIAMDGDNVLIENVAPDGGLSAPFNSWFTLFGQFFDHGLDLVNKGGSGTVYIPLSPDDPLYVPGSNTNFMVLTRATVGPGADGIMGDDPLTVGIDEGADDTRPVNTTTSFVDQNQTYTSHASHQVFLRQYTLNGSGTPVSTGNLIEGGGAAPGGMATWGEVKAQARDILGINLTDFDVGNAPLLRTDPYGRFIPDANGMPQIVVGIGLDGIPNTADDIVVSGNLAAPVDPTAVGALRIGHAFLADIAHDAVPFGKLQDGDIEIGLANPGNGSTEYDNELLDAHFIAGDGRANENIGLTAVHSIFHSEHNRLVDHTKEVVVADAVQMLANGSTQAEAVAFLNEWLITDVTEVPDTIPEVSALVWDGERLFQAAKFGTEMQYQHLVFEDFARKIQPNIDFFVVPDGYHADINPSIVSEFANVVYRFGHSMLNETVDRLDSSFNADPIGLIAAFLNPIEFDSGHTVADSIAAGDIIRGMTRQVGNEIDEFVTTALRNNLLGLPLDLATINLARGRDAGVPSLNAARREFYDASSHAPELKPYDSWVEFAANLKNEAAIINFVAAYGLHPLIVAEDTIEGKRAVAMAIIFGTDQPVLGEAGPGDDRVIVAADILDAVDFLNGVGSWASSPEGVTSTGLDNVDLWIGGLAEKILPFGGMLGSTFNFIFEVQLEQLQDGDRFYYLQRLDGLHLLGEMENNTFAKLIGLNADAGHLPSDVFSTPGLILEVDRRDQYNAGLGESPGVDGILLDDPLTLVDESADNLGNDPIGGTILNPLVNRNNPATAGTDSNYLRYNGADHVLLGGTENDDILIASEGDDTLYGDGGNDRMEGGAGNDSYIGGAGDDIITDLGGDDIIRSGPGNDAINAGLGTDLVVADEGHDFIVLGSDILDEAFAGVGNDYILGSKTTEQTLGGEGDDWIEIGAWTGAVGDNFDDQFAHDSVTGHDVFHGDGGFDEFIGEGGDDIWVGSPGRGKFDGMSGFDWATYTDMKFGVDADLFRLHFDATPLPPVDAALDEFSFVEAISGSRFDDKISGSDVTAADMPTEGYRGSVLTAQGIALIDGLQDVLGAGVTSFDAGNILLGGDGNDVITGRGGNDIIDGDKWLNVRISVRESVGIDGGVGAEIDSANSMKDLVTEIFNGTYNPGQLRIVREILTANGAGDIDVAVFSDVRANYDIIDNIDGTTTVIHARGTQADGTDTLRNIEAMRFADVQIGVNFLATGAAVISDTTPTEGQVLTIDTSSIADPNGLGAFSYQWQSSTDGVTWTDIGGATNASFTPDDNALTSFGDQAGLQLRVVTSFTDGAGYVESRNSLATGPVGVDWDGVAGADNVLVGTAGNDIGDGGSPGNDTMAGNAGDDLLNGGDGDDLVSGGAGNNVMDGGAGTDTADYSAATGPTVIHLDTGVTTNGLGGSDTLTGFENAIGSAQSDSIYGNASDNRIRAGAGNNIVSGGGGSDTADYSNATGNAFIHLNGGATSNGFGGTDVLTGMENAIGSAQNDTIIGNASVNALFGGTGTDYMIALGGNDSLDGGTGAANTLQGGQGDDTYYLRAVGDSIVEFNGEGYDRVEVYAPVVSVNLSTYFVEELRHNSATGITVAGNGLDNIIIGNVGSDYLVGFGGNDTLTGGTGAANTLQGGLGDDTYNLSALGDTALEFAGEGNDTVRTDLSVHTLRVNIENMVYTGVGTFTGTGNASANTITGGAGNDTLNGAGGADIINGGGGNDMIIQSSTAGSDFVDGGADSDTIRIDGDATSEAFVIYTRDAAITTGGISAASLNVNTEIVIVRNGTVISELDNVEEILINTLDVSANDGNGTPNGGPASGDTVTVVGDFTTTSLDYSTITINGGTADDTVDIGGLTSDHRIVFNSGGGTDNVVGGLRPQDVFNGSAQVSGANVAAAFELNEPVERYGDMRGLHAELTEISLMPIIA